jgi:hypothetical protein
MSSRSDEYRQRAAEAKNRAAQTSSRPIKRAFQKVARNWLLLAERAAPYFLVVLVAIYLVYSALH